jgi:hypothetical protein
LSDCQRPLQYRHIKNYGLHVANFYETLQ